MRKLNFLKTIVDFVWIMTIIAAPFLILFLGFVIIDDKPLGMTLKINGVELNVVDLKTKILLLFLIISSIMIVYSLFLFRKILRLFQIKKIFDSEVINNFNKIGILLMLSSFTVGIPNLLIQIMNKSTSLDLGMNPYVMIFCLGLFFLVLKEVFTIAKNQKEENELTI
ncbi:DUF2975 domain-containing protein [Flavobacterium sp.]|uniref:DUF2975 domain-containing protein n=1 Tax=Flavobacterium sp. TaxID=239 RepID=UPI003528F75E